MSMIPVGKNKHQVNQGGFKHESMLNTDIFASLAEKFALTPGSVLDKQEEVPPNVPNDLQSAMGQGGGLNPERGMPEGADMGGGQTSPGPDGTQMNGELGTPQSQTMGVGEGGFEQSLEAQYGPRVARIVGSFLNELRDAEMMSATFTPDPMGTKFTIGGGGLELKVPAMRGSAGKMVEKV